MSGDKVKEATASAKIVNHLDNIIETLRLEINRAQSIKDKYLGAEPESPKDGDSKEMSPNGHIEIVNRKLVTINNQIIRLNQILCDVDNSL